MSNSKQVRGEFSFFTADRLEEEFLESDNLLANLSKMIPWEDFRKFLSGVYSDEGASHYDELMLFKCLILADCYGLNDAALERNIRDRLSFRFFLGMNLESRTPDRLTIMRFRERLSKKGLDGRLFGFFNEFLRSKGLIVSRGSMIDATFVDTPRMRNSREENQAIKEGKSYREVYPTKSQSASFTSHKDLDARWVKKGEERHFGYKNHVTADVDSKLIKDFRVTPANVYDGNVHVEMLSGESSDSHHVYADSAYHGAAKQIQELGFIPRINEKGCRHRKLTQEQIEENRRKSKTRCRVEHVFADITNHGGTFIRAIGLAKAATKITLINLAYNLRRYVTILTKGLSEHRITLS